MVLTSQFQSRQMPVIQSYTSINNGNSPMMNMGSNNLFRPLRRRRNYIRSLSKYCKLIVFHLFSRDSVIIMWRVYQ